MCLGIDPEGGSRWPGLPTLGYSNGRSKGPLPGGLRGFLPTPDGDLPTPKGPLPPAAVPFSLHYHAGEKARLVLRRTPFGVGRAPSGVGKNGVRDYNI